MRCALRIPMLVVLAAFSGGVVAFAHENSHKLVGSQSCNSAACHGNQPLHIRQPRRGEEFARWLESDPHRRAAETLASDRYRDILLRASGRDDGEIAPQVQARCAKCHDPLGMTGDHRTVSQFGHGIGCESCHGNAEQWLARHYERDVEPHELTALGMVDTKNLFVRGKQCATCHVGSTTHDMNHDMIAAGHPPLRFELAAYHDLIPGKHWNENRERLEKRDFQVQLWAAGQTSSASARLELLTARCNPKQSNWPELAEYNCFSCHQSISGTSKGERKLAAGRPQWSPWNLTFAEETKSFISLRELFRNDFAPDQSTVAKLAAAARQDLAQTLASKEVTSSDALQWLNSLDQTPNADWETRCQQYLALVAVERARRDELAKQRYYEKIDKRAYNRRLNSQQASIRDLQQVRAWLEFEPASAKPVLLDEPVLFREKRAEIGEQLWQIMNRFNQPPADE